MIKVMIVDDSAVARSVLQEALLTAPDMAVIGVAPDPLFALPKMQREWPDVIITDIEMPRMDGLAFVRQIMEQRPTPIVVCSSLTEEGSSTAFEALDAGAVSIITKPTLQVADFLRARSDDVINAVRAAASANTRSIRLKTAPRIAAPPQKPLASAAMSATTDRIIAIGISTGGTQALEYVLSQLPADNAGLAIVQHMPPEFTRQFADRLNRVCAIEISEAKDGDRILPGRALIAPGGRHMRVKRCGAQYRVEIFDAPPVSRHRPSVDVLFRSVAAAAGRNALGIIMTGMGDDGARGLREMLDAGARTVAQDEETSVVYGMPREAVRHGAAQTIASIDEITRIISRYH
jgi:two-component system chemotaxis response regulator CheB